MPLLITGTIALTFLPIISLGVFITALVFSALLLVASIFTPVIGLEIFAPTIDNPIRAKNILEIGQRYSLFFKRQKPQENQELVLDFAADRKMP
ncbi:hypothetical protein [Legionella hackeliae]|uniref:Uncharacterized protein n=1 Tax=Legionella hackeliae TaxID=449 RepID=A0A0A8UVH4_LEGHA|nr:hypothetical protein [Legionella hackeliae]CEK10764.1 exported protein of unknown function [Legionella hackeliae]